MSVRAHQSQLVSKGTLFLHLHHFLHSSTAPVCFSWVEESLGSPHLLPPWPADWFEKLPWQALRGRFPAARRRRRPAEILRGAVVAIISLPRRCWDSGGQLWDVGGARKSGREAHVHLLTCSIYLFFLAERVGGGLSPCSDSSSR